LKQKISQITKEVDSFQAKSLEEVVVFRLKYLAKNGLLNALFNDFKNVSETEKKIGRAHV
jgi:hypothetical protein